MPPQSNPTTPPDSPVIPSLYPIAQAPTGGIAGPELCAAVCLAGGMGGMGLTWTTPETAFDWVRTVRAQVQDRPFLVNFVLHFPPSDALLQAALDAGGSGGDAPWVSFSWGAVPPQMAARVRQVGAHFAVQVTNADGARQALDAGAALLICQGSEAGGHVQASAPLGRLLPLVLAVAGHIPVIAAGGIASGAQIADVLNAGAAAAMLGTRFVATRESRAHPVYKAALLAARSGDETALTACFDGGWPYAAHRVLTNTTFVRWEAAGCPPVGGRPGEGETIAYTADGSPVLRYDDTAPQTGMTGNPGEMCLYAGTGVGAIGDIPPAGELVARLWAECAVAIAARGK